MAQEEYKSKHIVSVVYRQSQEFVAYETTSSGVVEAPHRLWLDLLDGRLYIMMDTIESYKIS